MNTLNIKLYDTLRRELNLSEEKSRAITQAIEETVLEELGSSNKETATQDFVKKEIKELELKIEQVKSELLKWFIGLFFGLALMIIGLYIKK